MEVKINREIRSYTESMFFGVTMRQFVFSLLAVVVAVGLYFLLRPYVGTETVSWMCVLGAAPFAALGFADPVFYHYDIDVGQAGDFVGHSLARKTIPLNGQRATIVAVILRGGGYGGGGGFGGGSGGGGGSSRRW